MFATDYDRKGVLGASGFSLALHVIVVLLLLAHNSRNTVAGEEYLLTEITIMQEVPEKTAPAVEPVRPKNMMDILKQVIPVKQPSAAIAAPKAALLSPEKPAAIVKAPALSLEKTADGLKPAMQAVDIDNEIGRKKIEPMSLKAVQVPAENPKTALQSGPAADLGRGRSPSLLPAAGPAGLKLSSMGSPKLSAAAPVVKNTAVAPKPTSADNTAVSLSKQALLIQGDAAGRKIVRQAAPEYPRWLQEQGTQASVTLLFYVKPDGSVKEGITVERTSGNTELDTLAQEALGQFRFEKLDIAGDQSGYATFRFVLER